MDTSLVFVIPGTGAAEAVLARCAEVLDPRERARAAALRDPRDARRFTLAHGARRLILARLLRAEPHELAWTRGPHGKPELAGHPLRDNISHSGDLTLLATSTARAVGVDVQHQAGGVDPVALAVRFFGADEAAHVAAGADDRDRHDRFADLWCRKEAVVKVSGGRLWPNLRMPVHARDVVESIAPVATCRVTAVDVPVGYQAAVAVAGDAPIRVESTTVDTATAGDPWLS